jgi:hypothetical protein
LSIMEPETYCESGRWYMMTMMMTDLLRIRIAMWDSPCSNL